MKQFVWVEVREKNESKVLVKLFKNNVEVFEIRRMKDGFQFKIKVTDYEKLKKIAMYRFRRVRYEGVLNLWHIIRKKWLILVGLFFFLGFLFFFSNVIVEVQVIHSNKEIRELVRNALEEAGIDTLTFKKSFREIEEIKENILNAYPDKLEWLEIEVDGMRYVVRIEERIITVPEEKKERCHLIATKSSIVRKIAYQAGDAKVSVNDFVKEGDILVSGEIMANENVTSTVCATGKVFGEVWYNTHVSLPMNYESQVETGKKRWNFMFSRGSKDTFLLRPRMDHFVNEKKHLFTLFGYEFYFVIQKEVQVEQRMYSEEEALSKSLLLVDEKMRQKIHEDEEILDKKVLKKNVNNSTMNIEVFVSVLENISKQEEFQGELEEGF